MRRPTYRMQRVRLADCRPHADKEIAQEIQRRGTEEEVA